MGFGAKWCRGTEKSISTLAQLNVSGDLANENGIHVRCAKDWFQYNNQKWVLEQRLALLIRSHMSDVEKKKDTSFSVYSLTMAYCDFVYWRGLWEVVITPEARFQDLLEPLAQVVSSLPSVFLHNSARP